MKARLLVLASGRGSNFRAILQSQNPVGEIVGLAVDRIQAGALEIAREFRLPVFFIPDETHLLQVINEINPDYLICAGYMRILSKTVIERMRGKDGQSRILNVHPSLLPELKGKNGYYRAFEAKMNSTGVSIHLVEDELDAGPILAQESFSIADCASVDEVEQRGLKIEHSLYPKIIKSVLESAGYSQ